jgi:nitrogen fixation-related uncharacterized protein
MQSEFTQTGCVQVGRALSLSVSTSPAGRHMKLSNKQALVLIAVVTLVWAANNLASIFVHEYRPDPSVNAVFLAIIAYLFAVKRNGKDDGDGG